MPKNLLLALGLVKPLRSSFNAFFSLLLDTPLNVTPAPVYNLSFAGTDFELPHPDHMKVTIINKNNIACLIRSLFLLTVSALHSLFSAMKYFFKTIIIYRDHK